jgi:hypothetical protein
MYWRGAFPGYAIKTQPQLGADVDINKEDVKQQLTDYSNALQRFLVLMGMDITALAPQVSDPASQIDTQTRFNLYSARYSKTYLHGLRTGGTRVNTG